MGTTDFKQRVFMKFADVKERRYKAVILVELTDDTLYPQNLALTSPTSGGRWV
jgi:hypothetical protein